MRVYDDIASLRAALPSRLVSGPLVLKRARGNAGLGVWKVEIAVPGTPPSLASLVWVQHAYDGVTEELRLGAVIERLAVYLDGGELLVEQPFLPRVADGMVRCYLSGSAVAGFAEHMPRGFVTPRPVGDANSEGAPVVGFDKVMHGPAAPAFRGLRALLESEWVPALSREVGLDAAALPAIWDIDFLRGARTPAGEDTWVLCEINASCVSPFPAQAADAIAETALARMAARPRR